MCGIAGLVGDHPPSLFAEDALDALRHRGPDAHGVAEWSGPGAAWQLVHTRLSIVDLSDAGGQPMWNPAGTLAMVFNGEIYNSPELRRGLEAKGHRFQSKMDGEVILHLWEDEGSAALERLNGIFAIAIADTRSGEVVIARDPLGVKPLVYSRGPGNALWFASELRALAAAGAPVGSSDPVALAQFLTFLWVPSPRTPFVGARSLEPGRALRWTRDGIELFSYATPLVPAIEPDVSPSASDVVAQLRERFTDAARRQLLADVPIGLMASGGVDSGLIWWAARDGLDRAYTIDWSSGDDVEGLRDDTATVATLERRFNTPVDFLPGEDADETLPVSGDLFADPAYDLTRLIARSARARGHKVLMSGQGGDELFAGYRRHQVASLIGRVRLGQAGRALSGALAMLPGQRLQVEYAARLARAAAERDPFRSYMQLCSYSTAQERARVLGCTEGEVSDDVVWQEHRDVYDRLPGALPFVRKAMALDLGVYLPGLGLAYVDRAGMEFGVEIRVPWLDLELVRWTLTLPTNVLMKRGRGKWLPRELAARELSPALAHRPKRAFAAPAQRVKGLEGAAGQRGFRQASYFARAERMLRAHVAANA
jgi:asparagine synthase (glutamine-hydrolysing)